MATPSLPFRSVESQFMQRTGSVYDSMVKRFREKRDKRDRIIRIDRTVPFTKNEFREWIKMRLGGEGGVVKCEYCSTYISAADMVVDHKVPPHRGGSLGFENLALSCKLSNDEKGSMTATGYVAMRTWALLNLDPDDCKEMLQRLAIAIQLAAQQRAERAKKFKGKATAAVLEEEKF